MALGSRGQGSARAGSADSAQEEGLPAAGGGAVVVPPGRWGGLWKWWGVGEEGFLDLEELLLEGGAGVPFVELVDDSAQVVTVDRDPGGREVATVRGQEVGGVGA